jgi:hypothetical protein
LKELNEIFVDQIRFFIPRKLAYLVLLQKVYLSYLTLVPFLLCCQLKKRKKFYKRLFLKLKYRVNRIRFKKWILVFTLIERDIFLRIKNFILAWQKIFF